MNEGSRSVKIESLTTRGNLRLLTVAGLPHRLAAHATSGPITVRVQINDCKAKPSLARGIYVKVDRPFGHVTELLSLYDLGNTISTACKRR
jgi:hypothetical protein